MVLKKLVTVDTVPLKEIEWFEDTRIATHGYDKKIDGFSNANIPDGTYPTPLILSSSPIVLNTTINDRCMLERRLSQFAARKVFDDPRVQLAKKQHNDWCGLPATDPRVANKLVIRSIPKFYTSYYHKICTVSWVKSEIYDHVVCLGLPASYLGRIIMTTGYLHCKNLLEVRNPELELLLDDYNKYIDSII